MLVKYFAHAAFVAATIHFLVYSTPYFLVCATALLIVDILTGGHIDDRLDNEINKLTQFKNSLETKFDNYQIETHKFTQQLEVVITEQLDLIEQLRVTVRHRNLG